ALLPERLLSRTRAGRPGACRRAPVHLPRDRGAGHPAPSIGLAGSPGGRDHRPAAFRTGALGPVDATLLVVDAACRAPRLDRVTARDETPFGCHVAADLSPEYTEIAMAITYGVLRGRPDRYKREDDASTPHLQIRIVDTSGQPWRIAVNVQ